MNRTPFPRSLRTRLVLAFGGLSLLVIALIFAVELFGLRSAAIEGIAQLKRTEALKRIESVANARRDALKAHLAERRIDIQVLAAALPLATGSPRQSLDHSPALQTLLTTLENPGRRHFDMLSLFAADRRMLVAHGNWEGIPQGQLDPLLDQALIPGNVELVRMTEGSDRRPKLLILRQVPAYDAQGRLTGAIDSIVVGIVDARTAYDLILTDQALRPGSGNLEQTLLVTAESQVIAQSESSTATAMARARAGLGIEATFVERDSKGREVLAVLRNIDIGPDTRWGLVTYLMLDEAMAPVVAATRGALLVGALTWLVALLLAWAASRLIAAPIENLHRVINRLADGDLQARVAPSNAMGIEMAALADGVNRMAEAIAHGQQTLEEEVRRKTAALQSSEEKYRDLVETSPDLVTHVDGEGRFLYVNGRAGQIFGLPPADCIGRYAFDFVHHEDRAATHAAFMAWFASGASDFTWENRQVSSDGTIRRLHWRIRLRHDDQGNPYDLISIAHDITRQHEIDAQLRDSESIHRAVVETSVDGFWRLDQTGHIVEVNDAYAAISGYTREELVGMHVAAFDSQESAEDAAAHMRRIAEHGQDRFVSRHRRRDGSLWDVEVSVSHVPLQEGMYCAFLRDITASKQANEAIKAERRRYMALVNSLDSIVCEADARTGTITFVSARAEKLLGYPVSDWYQADFWAAHLHPDDREWALNYSAVCTNRLEAHDIEYRFLAQDGRYVWLHHLVTVVAEENRPRWLRSIIVDISRAKDTENRLTDAAQRLGVATAASGLGIWEWQVAGGELIWDAQMLQLYGITRAEFDGSFTAWQSRVHPDDVEAATRKVTEALHSGQFAAEFRIVLGDGSIRHIKGYAALQRDADGHPTRMIGTNADVTEQRRIALELENHRQTLESRVAQRTAELLAANRELEAFAYTVAHDLRAPMRAILGFGAALREDCGEMLPQESRHLLDHMISGTLRMSALVEGLLDLSRTTHLELNHEALDLSRLARNVVKQLRIHTPECRIRFEIDENLHADGDRELVTTLLQQLLENACKFTAGVAAPYIRFTREERNGDSWFCVADNGAGFDMRYADKLFQPFQRLHAEHEFPGIGIGLAVAQRIVARHGGKIIAEAAPGQGARFLFTLRSGYADAADSPHRS